MQAWDRFAYVNNSPVRYNDPSGHCLIVCTAIIGAAIGAIVGAVGYTAYTAVSGTEFNTGTMLLAAGGGAVAGALIGTGVGWAAGVSAAEATTATVAVTGGAQAANRVCGGDACASEIQDSTSVIQKAGELIYRNASGTPDSLTPRLAKDVMGPLAEGKTPGLSFWNSLDKLNPGKYVTVDTSKLNNLKVVYDNDPIGHVTITTNMETLTQWANTRGLTTVMENAHKLTQEIWNAAGRIVQSQ